ncbi:MAG: chemotaxis protein, partial [Desulfovibrio sp.]|nr:chemotaxis protein [Desulfovibrio sp.]
MAEGFEDEATKNLRSMQRVVSAEVTALEKKYYDASCLMSENENLVYAINADDFDAIKSIVQEDVRMSDAQFITLADAKGNVIVRSHSEKKGDSVLNQSVVQNALRGQASVNIEAGSVVKFSVRAASPIKSGDRIIGVLVVGEAFDSNRFVDKIKAVTGVEMTIFKEDMRVSTTLM